MRTRSSTLTLSALAILGATALPVAAAGDTFTIDPSHSQVEFRIRHFVSKVPGRFGKYKGTITADPNNLASAVISVEIETASINTDEAERDEHLRGPDFFDVAHFPKMTFVSTQVVPKGSGKASMKGDLTLHGVTRPVDLDVDILGFMDGRGGIRAGFEARGTINRKDFGMVWNRVLDTGGTILGDDVEILLNIEASREKPKVEAKPAAGSNR